MNKLNFSIFPLMLESGKQIAFLQGALLIFKFIRECLLDEKVEFQFQFNLVCKTTPHNYSHSQEHVYLNLLQLPKLSFPELLMELLCNQILELPVKAIQSRKLHLKFY